MPEEDNTNPEEGQNEGGQPNESGQQDEQKELESKIATLEEEKSNLIGELKDDRKRRQELTDEIENLKEDLKKATEQSVKNENIDSTKVADVVRNVLSEEAASKAKDNFKVAFEKFVNENKEYHEENDASGLKRDALERKLKRFNTEGLYDIDDFYSVIKDANNLLRGPDTPRQASEGQNINSPSTPSSKTAPQTVPQESDLSETEKNVIERIGMSKERFQKLKERDPRYVEDLMQYAR